MKKTIALVLATLMLASAMLLTSCDKTKCAICQKAVDVEEATVNNELVKICDDCKKKLDEGIEDVKDAISVGIEDVKDKLDELSNSENKNVSAPVTP